MILIVDDLPEGAKALCKLLTLLGYPCKWVTDGPTALATIRSHSAEQPLLVLLDQMMPIMTGLEVLSAIRTDHRISQTNVIMFSADFDSAKRDEAITLGAVAWLYKGGSRDCGMDQIIKTITDWYERVGGVRSKR